MRRLRRSTLTGTAAAGCLLLLTACGHGRAPAAEDAAPTPVRAAQPPPRSPSRTARAARSPTTSTATATATWSSTTWSRRRATRTTRASGSSTARPADWCRETRQLLTPKKHATPVDGQLPAVFEAEASCDLDGDGFTDLVVTTDPPYDGQGRPSVPLQLLFGSPSGPTGRAVPLTIPDRARYGNDWPERPVCGDFDGDGAEDLVVHASAGRLSHLRGPFTRKGVPHQAGAPVPSPGEAPTGPATDVNRDGYDDLVVRTSAGPGKAALVLGGPAGPARTGATLPAGVDIALGAFGRGKALDAAVGGPDGTAMRYDLPTATRGSLDAPGSVLDAADFDGDGLSELVSSGSGVRVLPGRKAGPTTRAAVTVRPTTTGTTRVLTAGDFDGDGLADLVVRTSQGDTKDSIEVHRGAAKGLLTARAAVTFSTSQFLTP
ncbi:VCBS repeat-containing protein OS=Streptomyces tendae OX=1932 GN=GUR47_20020 PE=4 SV=1 [Streptomyces tendae]